MSEKGGTYAIVLGHATDDHRNAAHEIVKAHARNWWHHLPDMWIAIGHTHQYWANLIKPVLALSEARVLVLELPRGLDARMFALRGPFPSAAQTWLWESYHGRRRPVAGRGLTLPSLRPTAPAAGTTNE